MRNGNRVRIASKIFDFLPAAIVLPCFADKSSLRKDYPSVVFDGRGTAGPAGVHREFAPEYQTAVLEADDSQTRHITQTRWQLKHTVATKSLLPASNVPSGA